jgi:hypothetical protein
MDRGGEGKPDARFDIAAPGGDGSATPASDRAGEPTEDLLKERVGPEEVLEVGDVGEILPAESSRTKVRLHAFEAPLVVPLARLGRGQDLVGFGDLLELLLRDLWILLRDVGVVLPSESPVGLLDLVGGGGAGNAEDIVVVFLRHGGDDR